MEIKEEKARIWSDKIEGKDGNIFYRYKVAISRKGEDGKWVSTSMPIQFSKTSGAPKVIENGTTCSIEGFMSVRSWKDRDGNNHNDPIIIAMKALFDPKEEDMGDSFHQAEDDIPF